ncbi:phage portal protein [Methylopila sp. Yamaguchi]|uniref:phage portal protein n=1 Tax=Methylopila sp. Yamaguchi TaxID=1437817 RepID=UPI000CB2EBD4|nr:phage portal protein [Methylopila sp. Yamaguchi]GBD48091.1 HK97 family phage portal protein [Methylopila sp. Yamaguchi]
MGIMDLFRGRAAAKPAEEGRRAGPRADVGQFISLDDERLREFLCLGTMTPSGVSVTTEKAMKVPAVHRSVSLISQTVGMLPLHLIDNGTKEKAKDHPLFPLLHREPNNFQSAFDFRTLLQHWALTEGDGYALVVRRPNDPRTILRMIPLNPAHVKPKQNDDWSVGYRYTPSDRGARDFDASEILHIRGMTRDGIRGISLVKQAADAIALAISADLAIGRLFKNGTFSNIYLSAPETMSDEAFERLRNDFDTWYSGADNAGRTPLFEDGVEPKSIGANAKDSQSNETRARQVEEIARIFGVPRPLLMIDETSWGSGIDVLGQFFVRYGLNPWFEAWQQAISRTLLVGDDKEQFAAKFNPGALLRGSMQQQGEFFAKALGAGGHQPWMHWDEVRDALDLPVREKPQNTMMGHNGGPALNDN